MSVPPPDVNTVVTAVASKAAAPAAGAAAVDAAAADSAAAGAAAAGAAAAEITIGYVCCSTSYTRAAALGYVLYLGNRYLTYFCYPADGSARRRRYSP